MRGKLGPEVVMKDQQPLSDMEMVILISAILGTISLLLT